MAYEMRISDWSSDVCSSDLTDCHFGTGNYHPVTARIYTDLSFFTADPRAGRAAAALFNYITGYVEPQKLELLTMSPRDMRNRLCDLIEAEITHVLEGRSGTLWATMNSRVEARKRGGSEKSV